MFFTVQIPASYTEIRMTSFYFEVADLLPLLLFHMHIYDYFCTINNIQNMEPIINRRLHTGNVVHIYSAVLFNYVDERNYIILRRWMKLES